MRGGRVALGRVRAGHVFSHGEGFLGTLGLGGSARDSVVVPERVGDARATRLAAGWGHTAFIDAEGGAHVFGRPFDVRTLFRMNNMHSIFPPMAHLAAALHRSMASDVECLPLPRRLGEMDPSNRSMPLDEDEVLGRIRSVAANVGYTALTGENGEVHTFGSNIWGQCGVGSDALHVYWPTRLYAGTGANRAPLRVRSVSAGFQHSVALPLEGGGVYTWGKGERGALGRFCDEREGTRPGTVPELDGLECTDAVAGHAFSAAAAREGDGSVIYIWGKQQSLKVKRVKEAPIGDARVAIYEDQASPRRVDLRAAVNGAGDARPVEGTLTASGFHLAWQGEDGALYMCGQRSPSRSFQHAPLRVLPPGARLPGPAQAQAWLDARRGEGGAAASDADLSGGERVARMLYSLDDTLLLTEDGQLWGLRLGDDMLSLPADPDACVQELLRSGALRPKYLRRPWETAPAGVAHEPPPPSSWFAPRRTASADGVVRWVRGPVLDAASGFRHSVVLVGDEPGAPPAA